MKNIIHVALLQAFLVVFGITELAADPPPAYEGRRLYVSYCQLCHGVDGKGNGPLAKAMKITPADLTTTVRSRSDTILKKIISGTGDQTITGRARHNVISDAMPEWKEIFDEAQIESLIAYLRFMSRSKHDLIGDPKEGLLIYNKYCHVCHGVDGDGEGVMTKLLGIVPMDFTNANETNPLDNHQLMISILDGKGRFMPGWRNILSQEDVEALVSYIRLLSH